MKRNKLRVVCNPYTNQISYYFKNELDEWTVLSGNSPLSRQYYTKTSMQERASDIVKKLDEIYNRKNKGLDILFEGTADSFDCLEKSVKNNLRDRDIICRSGITKIAVVGKKSVGKTTLIEGLEELQGYKYTKEKKNGYTVYTDECNHAEWYEIDGIDLGISEIDKTWTIIRQLAGEGITAVIYCISATSGRIEDVESHLLTQLEKELSAIMVMVALTMCYKDEADIKDTFDSIEKVTDQMKIVPTLAKPYKTAMKDKNGDAVIIKPFGVDMVSKYVFEGR